MTWNGVEEYLRGLTRFGVKAGLDRIRALLKGLGNPEERLRIIHVAGTNGKGSTCAMLASIMEAAGYKTGLFTSPHLIRYNERFQINRVEISDAELFEYGARVAQAAEGLKVAGDPVTVFEFTTALGFLYFAEARVDVAIMETGLGGRLDATNVGTPELSVITHISYDHTEVLGDTLTAIAMEKAGIIRPRGTVVVAPQSQEALTALEKAAGEKRARLVYVGPERVPELVDANADGMGLTWRDGVTLRLPLLGIHQVDNAAVVRAVVTELCARGWKIPEDVFVAGMQASRWPGRLELLPTTPPVLLDGAHNLDGAEALRTSIDRLFSHQTVTYVVALTGKKPVAEMVRQLNRPGSRFVFTAPRSVRLPAESPDRLVAQAVEVGVAPDAVFAADCIDIAMPLAQRLTGCGGLICVCGSLYLVGEAKAHLAK